MTSRRYDLLVLGGGIVGIWTALSALARGLTVAVVEVGPAVPAERAPALPELRFPERVNEGALKARNHVLTGNSSFWGGGIVRNPRQALREMFGGPEAPGVEDEVSAWYAPIERRLGIEPRTSDSQQPVLSERTLEEVAVLPGKRRGLWQRFLSDVGSHGERLACYTRASVHNLRRAGDSVTGMTVSGPDGDVEVEATWVVLSSGVVDSVSFVQRELAQALPVDLRSSVGKGLHDHWSVPVAKIVWRSGTPLSALFPPKFGRGGILGRRVPLTHGFFHLTADFDRMKPYAQVKALLAARQRGAGWMEQLGAGARVLGHPLLLLATGVHKVLRGELRIPNGTEIALVLDVESAVDPRNCLSSREDHLLLNWDVRPADEERFLRVMAETGSWWQRVFQESRLDHMWRVDPADAEGMRAYFRQQAVDAYHLGGGLARCPESGKRITDVQGKLTGWRNVVVCGTAAAARPGPANPVLTLLARAEVALDSICGSRVVT